MVRQFRLRYVIPSDPDLRVHTDHLVFDSFDALWDDVSKWGELNEWIVWCEERLVPEWSQPVGEPALSARRGRPVTELPVITVSPHGRGWRAGRRAIGVELDERYCEIAAKRLCQDTLFGGVA